MAKLNAGGALLAQLTWGGILSAGRPSNSETLELAKRSTYALTLALAFKNRVRI
jgi:hypothetical protein